MYFYKDDIKINMFFFVDKEYIKFFPHSTNEQDNLLYYLSHSASYAGNLLLLPRIFSFQKTIFFNFIVSWSIRIEQLFRLCIFLDHLSEFMLFRKSKERWFLQSYCNIVILFCLFYQTNNASTNKLIFKRNRFCTMVFTSSDMPSVPILTAFRNISYYE